MNTVKDIKGELKKYLSKNGAYRFCKMAEEIKDKSESYCLKTYGTWGSEVYNTANAVFRDFTFDTEDIKSFLNKAKTVPRL